MSDPPSGFRELELQGRYRGFDNRVEGFYLPVLARAVRYDRLVGYWRSSSLVVAATGLSAFARNKGRMRVIAGAELTDADIEAIRHGVPLEEALAARLIASPEEAGDIVADHRYEVLAWMLKEDLLEIRIGVRVDSDGQPLPPAEAGASFHSKFGVFEDANGDLIAFSGSDNETASGWRNNHETFHVYRSWGSTETWIEHGYPTIQDFEQHWDDSVPGWKVIEFPDEARDFLLRRAPAEQDWVPPEDPETPKAQAELTRIREAPKERDGSGVGFVTLPIEPWPHQASIASRVLETWPRSYLLADEVGLGKTIETGLIVRELLLSGNANRILLLVPASVQRQWQEELWEKFLLDVPSYNGKGFTNYDRESVVGPAGANPWSAFPVVLASSHLARMRSRRIQVLTGGPWDLVFVDEAHHARRRGIGGTEGANQLLQLLRELRDSKVSRALLLATATPMQMNTHEVRDLLDIFTLPGRWAIEVDFEAYYRQLNEPDPKARDWELLRDMLRDFKAQPDVQPNRVLEDRVQSLPGPARTLIRHLHQMPISGSDLAARPPEQRQVFDAWFRVNTPIKDRVFRTTRQALREYQRQGILGAEATIPRRRINDEMIDFETKAESELYERVEGYITRYYGIYNQDVKTRPLGFIMTVYRRRLTSSLNAVYLSLSRRLGALRQEASLDQMLDEDDLYALEAFDFDAETLSDRAKDYGAEMSELASFIDDLRSAIPTDTKGERLAKDIQHAFEAGHRTVVVFTQFADTLNWLRDVLVRTYGSQIACYTGQGGSRWDGSSRKWAPIPKEDLKNLFRAGREVRILLGTDALSEGLNLQTCDRLFNYDMPWNFMRVEQRIGRIDRIGGRPEVVVTNYFYRDTVEEQVYTGIKDDAEWFESVVGPAQPVLARVEEAISTLAMRSPDAARQQAIDLELAEVRMAIKDAQQRPVTLDTLETEKVLSLSGYASLPAINLEEIEAILKSHAATASRMRPHPDLPRTYLVEAPGEKPLMTFDRKVYDENPDIAFMTYGHPVFDDLVGYRR